MPDGHTHRTYLPGFSHEWLLPLYDPLTKWLGIESAHRRLLDQADIQPGRRVLEIGCGTGNLTILAKWLHPEAHIIGLDPDPRALARAGRKAERKALSIQLDHGFSDALPYPDGSFDRVLSALMFHHLLSREISQEGGRSPAATSYDSFTGIGVSMRTRQRIPEIGFQASAPRLRQDVV
jgi:SAM-dependent methyltransferase